MKLDKAIEILTHLKAVTNSASRQDCEKAYQLGIEALKRHRDCETFTLWKIRQPLPGETEDYKATRGHIIGSER